MSVILALIRKVLAQVYALELGLRHKLAHQRADYFRVSPQLRPKKHVGMEETWYGRNFVRRTSPEDALAMEF